MRRRAVFPNIFPRAMSLVAQNATSPAGYAEKATMSVMTS